MTMEKTTPLSGFINIMTTTFMLLAMSGSAGASGISIHPERVLSVVTADWNSDGDFDRAVLIESDQKPGGSELLIYLSEPKTETMKLALRKLNPAWSGSMWGTLPRLELDKSNNLVIRSQNDAIGRNRWKQSMNVAYKDGKFVVTRFTYEATDTLKPDYHLICSMNFLNGKGMRNSKALKFQKKIMPVLDWEDEFIHSICGG